MSLVNFHLRKFSNIKGNPYPIKTEFIITHPNDKGMKMIADEIYKNIEL